MDIVPRQLEFGCITAQPLLSAQPVSIRPASRRFAPKSNISTDHGDFATPNFLPFFLFFCSTKSLSTLLT